jgi:hypothetical protein
MPPLTCTAGLLINYHSMQTEQSKEIFNGQNIIGPEDPADAGICIGCE